MAKPALISTLRSETPILAPAIYFYAGEQESKGMVDDMNEIISIMKQRFPQTVIKAVLNRQGRHTESEWKRQFPAFFRWLLD